MAKDKEKGLTGSASDRLRETTGALRGEGPWYSANQDVYHNNSNCQTGKWNSPGRWFFLAFGEEVRQAGNREDPVDH